MKLLFRTDSKVLRLIYWVNNCLPRQCSFYITHARVGINCNDYVTVEFLRTI
jgi:hypothetical protein